MYRLRDNYRGQIDFAVNADYEIEVSFTKWTNKVAPIVKETFDFIKSDSGKNFEMMKTIFCKAGSQETDATVTHHLVLFIKEVRGVGDDQLTQTETIPLRYNDKFRLVTVRYFISDTNIPNVQDIDCKFYHDLIDNLPNAGGKIIPDTNNGSIIIKR